MAKRSIQLNPFRPAPGQRHGIHQGCWLLATQQHQGHNTQAVEIHPDLIGLVPGLGWGVAGCGSCQRLASNGGLEAEINQHRQSIAIAADQIGGGQIAMHQVLAMQGSQGRQQLAQQQQHLTRTKNQLPLLAGLLQVLVGAPTDPLAHLPATTLGRQLLAQAGNLWMQHRLEPLQALLQRS